MIAPHHAQAHRAPAPPSPTRAGVLQRCACGGAPGPTGECAACRRKRLLQPKLAVNAPGDRYEREADRVAEHVTRAPGREGVALPRVQQAGGHALLQRQVDEDVLEESERQGEDFRRARRRDLGRVIEGLRFQKVLVDCPESTGVRLHDVLAGMRRRVAGNAGCRRFFQQHFGVDPERLLRREGPPTLMVDPDLPISGRTRCPSPSSRISLPICTSPLRERVIMHEFTHYAGCLTRSGAPSSEALAEQGTDVCMGTVQEALDAARRARQGQTGTGTPAGPTPSPRLQPKLVVNVPGDRYEREADRVADTVMRMPEAGTSSPLRVQRVESGRGEAGMEAPPVVHAALRAPGRPLDVGTRAFMEARLGHDLSSVRVHTDAQAAASARAVGARAYTVGRDVVFGAGHYAPDTAAGRGLLAHELVHVAQQREGAPDGLQRQALEYDTDAITTRPPTQPFTLKDAQDLINAEKKAKTLASATVAGTLAPAGSDAELFLLHLIAQLASTDRWGSVADLVVQIGWPPAAGKPAPTGLVTVTFDAQGNATAELLSTTPVAAPTTHPDKSKAIEAIKKTYGIADVTAATGSAWTLDELNKLDGALALLPSQDRGALKGVVLERVATLPNSRAGEFDYKQEIVSGATTATNTAVLRLADSAFSGDTVGFVGDATSASPASYQTIIHEVGHAVATRTVRETTAPLHTAMAAMNAASAALNPTVEPLNQAAETLNDLVKQYNEADQAGKAELKPQVDAARADYNAKKKAYDPKKAAFDAAEKKVTALKGPAETAKNNQALLTAIETTITARKQAATTALATAQTAATAYAAPVKTESDGYRTAAAAAGTKIDAYATALLTAGTDPAVVAQAETDAVDAVQARDAARASLTNANAKNAALTDFAPVDAAQDAWLEALRLRSSVTGEGKALQGFVDLVLRERIAPFTEYARDNWPHEPGEFFAEAYSLWRTDPNYLKTNAKKIYDWFNAGSYR